jgi:hypothetical protein
LQLFRRNKEYTGKYFRKELNMTSSPLKKENSLISHQPA